MTSSTTPRSVFTGGLARWRRVVVGILCATAISGAGLGEEAADEIAPVGVPLIDEAETDVIARFEDGRQIVVSVRPEEGEGYLSVARRMCGDSEKAAAVQAANRGLPLVIGRPVTVPWDLLRAEYRVLALGALFPEDAYRDGAWEHRPRSVRALNHSEGLWQVAVWFTGRGENWQQIALFNGISDPRVGDTDLVKIPHTMLLPLFKPQERGANGALTYGADAAGGHAIYRLRKGEALYSAVVLRFTELVEPNDVKEAATAIARISGIDNVRDIPVGYRVKIPFDLLALPYLPDNHPRQMLAKIRRDELDALGVASRPTTRSLDEVHIILDAGHGGADIGASKHRIWESDYVYDVACRFQRKLTAETGAKVHMVVRDTQHGCKVFDSKKLVANKKEVVDTHPPHRANGGRSTRVGVNLRWYLANAIYHDLTRNRKVPPEKIVFLSLHADSLHKSLRGAMAYIPGANYRSGTHAGAGSSYYKKYREWKLRPKTSFTRKERLRDEIMSRKLATSILQSYRDEKLPVHLNRPVRDHVVRSRGRRRPQRWLPAVLRGNMVPAKVLVETVNINNSKDAALLEDPRGRERIASALSSGVRMYFGDERAAGDRQAAARGSRTAP